MTPEEIKALAATTPTRATTDTEGNWLVRSLTDIGAMTALRVLNIPFSVMHTPIEAMIRLNNGEDPDKVYDDVGKAFTGERSVGAADILSASGMGRGPASSSIGIVADVLNPFDPLKPLRIMSKGATAAGAIGKAASIAGKVDEPARSIISYAGKSLFGKNIDRAVMDAATAAKDVVAGTAVAQSLATVFKSRRSLENIAPELALKAREIQFENAESSAQFVAQIKSITDNPALSDEKVLSDVTDIIEGQAGKPIRVITKEGIDRRGTLIDEALSARSTELTKVLDQINAGNTVIARTDVPNVVKVNDIQVATPEPSEADNIASAIRSSIAARRESLSKLTEDSPKFRELRDEADYLQRQLDMYDMHRVDPNDRPVQYIQNAIRLRAIDELDQVRSARVFGGASDKEREVTAMLSRRAAELNRAAGRSGVVKEITKQADDTAFDVVDYSGKSVGKDDEIASVLSIVKPYHDEIKAGWEERLKRYDPNFEMPNADWLKHVLDKGRTGVFWGSTDKKQRITEITEEVKTRLLADGASMYEATDRAEKFANEVSRMSGKYTHEEMMGRLAAFMPRRYQGTIRGINMGNLGFKFNESPMEIVNRELQEYHRGAALIDLHDFAAKKYGVSADAYSSMPSHVQQQFKRLDFHVPMLSESVQPFKNVYVQDEVYKMLQGYRDFHAGITTDDGFKGVLEVGHKITNWWKAWTLLPFPSFQVRNMVDAVGRAHIGGLRITDPESLSYYRAAAGLMSEAAPTTRIGSAAAKAASAVDGETSANVLGELKSLFPGKFETPRDIKKWMYVNDIVSDNHFREIDFSQRLGDAMDAGGSAIKKFFRSLTPGHELENPMLRRGAQTAKIIDDLPRSAMFMQQLVKNGRSGMDLEQATANAQKHVFRYLFDPTGKNLSNFEYNVVKMLIPFYQFSRNNIPFWAKELVQEPGKISTLYRAYNGAQDAYSDYFDIRNAPEYLRDNYSLPIMRTRDAEGNDVVMLWSAAGWLSITDLIDFANIWNPYGGDGEFAKNMIGRANPFVREPLEQAFNYDTYMERKIREGRTVDMFGLPVPDWAAHILKNIRLLNEMDRLNPFDAFTGVGNYLGTFKGERPNRIEAEQGIRVLGTLTGLKGVPISEAKAIRGEQFKLNGKMQETRRNYNKAVRAGDTANMQNMEQQGRDIQQQLSDLQRRLNEYRQRQAANRNR